MSTFSISGIYSGIDTDSYVDAIMEVEREPAVLWEEEQAEKTNIITAYKALQAKVIALQTQLKVLARSSTFEAASVTVSDEDVIDATATGRVATGSYDIQVLSMARNHQIASQGFDDSSLSTFGTGTITIGVGDRSQQVITIDSSNNSLVGIAQAINDADAGVRANIINDGSESNPYRLVLSAENTGAANKISITSDLIGGDNLNYSTASFDAPETLSFDSGSTAQIALGTTAAYTGSENKIYTFTVDGTGSQTVGSDNITLNWTDGTNSGSIVITQADTEVELVGDGSDGLKLALSSGQLSAGDTFQVATFSPLLQDASDARIALGSSGGTGSPITVTSKTNSFSNIIAGVSLTVKQETEEGEYVTIGTDVDVEAIKDQISSVIEKYNAVMSYIDDQNSYDTETEESGVLFGDYTLQVIQNSMRSAMSLGIEGLDSKYNQLYSVGIRTGTDGTLSIKDSSQLEEALRENLDEVVQLFTSSGVSNSNYINYVSSSVDTEVGEKYEVNITRAATHGIFRGSNLTDPSADSITLTSSNNKLKFSINGVHSDEIVLAEKTYNSADELVREIQEKIDNDDKIGDRGLTVEWVSTGSDSGYLQLTSSTYGSKSQVEIITSISNSAFATLGLAAGLSIDGVDVEGTINGESATGNGQILTGDEGNATTDGLKLEITLDASQIVSGAEGSITVTKGLTARLGDLLESYTATGEGLFDSRISSYQSQVKDLEERIAEFDERLELRRERLEDEFLYMEEVIGELTSTSDYLTSQLENIEANWKSN